MFKLRLQIIVTLLFVFLGTVEIARAQSGDVFFGVGTYKDKSAGINVQNPINGVNYFGPKMTGGFGSFGVDYMFKPTLGVNFEYAFKFSQANYVGLNYRPKFYDFNAVWLPIENKEKVVPELEGGFGGASLSFYYPAQCVNGVVCTSSTYLTSSSHLQVHFSGGVRFYVKGNIFLRPQFDAHYVRNFYQFGSNWAPGISVALGYTFGRQ